MPIDNVQFPLNGKKLSAAKLWSTTVLSGISGLEVRNANWSYPLHRFNAAAGVKSLDDLQTLLIFHTVMQGRQTGFLIFDATDYKTAQTSQSLPKGGSHRGTAALVASTTDQYQLFKSYTFGARTQLRKITRPKVGSLLIYSSALAQITSGFSVNYDTGIVTSTTAVGYWSGEFFVPCRFESDELPFDLLRFSDTAAFASLSELGEISITEIRE